MILDAKASLAVEQSRRLAIKLHLLLAGVALTLAAVELLALP
jgi:hypothetical protein